MSGSSPISHTAMLGWLRRLRTMARTSRRAYISISGCTVHISK